MLAHYCNVSLARSIQDSHTQYMNLGQSEVGQVCAVKTYCGCYERGALNKTVWCWL